jgi:thioredoxin-related protein
MKRALFIVMAFISLSPSLFAQDNKSDNKEIHWITNFDELQAKMQQEPRKVYMDVYTDWCGWCKKMEATTFTDPNVIRYINTNFYAVRFNAERQDNIHFNGKEYHYEPQYKANTLAAELLNGKMGYPTSVFMLENFTNPTPISSYLDVKQLEMFLTFFGDNNYKHITWENYQKQFKSRWDKGVTADNTPPSGHISPSGH